MIAAMEMRRASGPMGKLSELLGLEPAAGRVGFLVLGVFLIADACLQTTQILLYGAGTLDGSGSFLGVWDVVKATATGGILLFVAWRLRSMSFGAFAFVFFLIGVEDQVGLHNALEGRIVSLIPQVRSGEGWLAQNSDAVGTLAVLTLFALGGFVFIWIWRRPRIATARRARVVLTCLLITLYVLAGGLDFLGSVSSSRWWPALEETGERVVMTMSLAYSLALTLPGELKTIRS